ncbi:MAG TPA: acetate--CoA ligase family protein [Thermoplasmata archaeon]|nr:acetate--CoA ligase family protein [Thermoplasmata archaeon]
MRSIGTTVLPEYASRRLLEAYGIPFARARRVTDRAGALDAAKAIGYPVALKVASPEISHKTDVGGVALDLRNPAALSEAFAAMGRRLAERAPNARIEGFEVEEMIGGGKEVLVGVQRDPAFGPIVVFGLGGIYVEVLKDVTFRLAPIRPLSAEHMVASVRGFPLLQGVRGEPPSDLPALYEVLELDVNPLIVRPKGKGVVAVDARVAIAPPSRSAPRASPVRSAGARRRTHAPGAAPRRRR